MAIERLRCGTGMTWAKLLRSAPARPRIIITPWQALAGILARREVAE